MSALGIWILEENGVTVRRPKSKKEIREIAAESPHRVRFEQTSAFPTDYVPEDAADLAVFQTVTFVGPDPYSKRNFFGQITNVGFEGAAKVVVK